MIPDVGDVFRHRGEALVQILAQLPDFFRVLREPLLLPRRGDRTKQRYKRQRRRREASVTVQEENVRSDSIDRFLGRCNPAVDA